MDLIVKDYLAADSGTNRDGRPVKKGMNRPWAINQSL
jgi:hypothetical protein